MQRSFLYRFLPLVFAFLLTACVVRSASGDKTPMFVASFAGYDRFAADLEMVGALCDRPAVRQAVEGLIAMSTQGRGLEGIDATQPWGLVVYEHQDDMAPIALLPVSDFEEVADTFELMTGIELTQRSTGVFRFDYLGQRYFVKENAGYAMVAPETEFFEYIQDKPSRHLEELAARFDLAAQINLQAVPIQAREAFLIGLMASPGTDDAAPGEAGDFLEGNEGVVAAVAEVESEDDADDDDDDEDGADDEEDEEEDEEDDDDDDDEVEGGETELKQILTEVVERMGAQTLLMLAQQGRSITIGVKLDEQQRDISLDVRLEALPGTDLARQLDELDQRRSRFAGFVRPDATFAVNGTFPNALSRHEDVIEKTLDQIHDRVVARLEEAELRDPDLELAVQSLNDLREVVHGTLVSDEVDFGGQVKFRPGDLNLVFGYQIVRDAQAAAAVDRLVTILTPRDDSFSIASTRVDGISWHQFRMPVDEDDEAREVFGDKMSLMIGLGEDVLYVGVGRQPESLIKECIANSSSEVGQDVPVFRSAISVGDLIAAAGELDTDPKAQQLTAVLAKQDGARQIEIEATSDDASLDFTIRVAPGLLRAFAELVEDDLR